MTNTTTPAAHETDITFAAVAFAVEEGRKASYRRSRKPAPVAVDAGPSAGELALAEFYAWDVANGRVSL